MYIKELKLQNFRNYDRLNITFTAGLNIIVGLNAQGKTNLLESIYVLNTTKSHRTSIDKDLIKEKKKNFKIEANLITDNFQNLYKLYIDDISKKLFINNTAITKISDYLKDTGVIIFYPEDLDLIKGNPQQRRKYLYTELSQLNTSYVMILADYNKLLKMRNNLLKKEAKKELIDVVYFEAITDHLITRAVYLYKYRTKFIEKINKYAPSIYSQIGESDHFQIIYKNNLDIVINDEEMIKAQLLKLYNNNHKSEVRFGASLYGPHKDDFEFVLNGKNLQTFGSQGQQRIGVLSLKLSEIDIFKETKKTNPIVLLDDIFSELDVKKRNNVMKYLNSDIQTIITTTDLKNIKKKILKNAKIFIIDEGKVREETTYGN